MYLTVCPFHGPGPIPDFRGVFQGIFPRLITLWQKMTHFPLTGTAQPCGNQAESPEFNQGQTMAAVNECYEPS